MLAIMLVERELSSIGSLASGESAGDFHGRCWQSHLQISLAQTIRAANFLLLKTLLTTFVIASGLLLPARAAVMLGQTEDFSGIHGWTSGGSNPNPPVIGLDSGPLGSGDSSLRVTSNGGGGPGGKLVAFNRTLWAGDYTAAGVSTITADLRNSGNTQLSFRLALNGPGGWFVTEAAPVSAFSGWNSKAFDLRPSSLIEAGGSSAESTLAAVSELRILHSVLPSNMGAQVSSSFMVDNIRAVPEPSVVTMVALVALGCILRKGRPF